MRLHRGMVIKHRRYRDVAFRIDAVISELGRYEVHGWWINQGYTKSWLIDKAIIKVKWSEVDNHDWLYCVDPEMKCIRDSDWLRL